MLTPTIHDLLAHRQDDTTNFLFHTPFAINSTDSEDIVKISKIVDDKEVNPVLKIFVSAGLIWKMPTTKLSSMKAAILCAIADIPDSDNSKETIAIRKILTKAKTYIDTYKQDNHLLESAMLNFAPIVEYSSILKKAEFTGKYEHKLGVDASIIDVLTCDRKMLEKYLIETLPEFIFDILMIATPKLLATLDELIGNNLLAKAMKNKFPDPYSWLYIAFVIHYIPQDKYKVLADTIDKINDMNSGIPVQIESVIEDLVDINTNEYSLETILRAVTDVKPEEEAFMRKSEEAYIVPEIERSFELDALTSFISSHTRYKCSPYANALYANKHESTSGYSMYSAFNTDGTQVTMMLFKVDNDRFGTVASDMGDDWKLKLITVDKGGRIEVSDELETV
jgi:hypothetical protein